MKSLLQTLGALALALTCVPPILFATGALAEATLKALLLVGTALWFATAPFWMKGGTA
jgi:hypothetical protein